MAKKGTVKLDGVEWDFASLWPKRGFTIEQINSRLPGGCLLTALRPAFSNGVHKKALFLCNCGVEKEIMVYSVLSGNTKSCGCFRDEYLLKPKKYSVSIKALRSCYSDMIGRCYNPKYKNYRIYGAMGVTVCDEWRESYQNFLDWALSNGWEPGLSLDKDIKGDGTLYSPSTCVWVTQMENANHTKRNKKFKYNGGYYTIAQISRQLGVTYTKLKNLFVYWGDIDVAVKKLANGKK